eukprot:scpid95468/ scgid10465/ 
MKETVVHPQGWCILERCQCTGGHDFPPCLLVITSSLSPNAVCWSRSQTVLTIASGNVTKTRQLLSRLESSTLLLLQGSSKRDLRFAYCLSSHGTVNCGSGPTDKTFVCVSVV